ncbi:MAG: hypothetical protein JXD21_01455 [Candidatus Omnitrophica bacterium]|nr:hypothetical protein [Candidatus Omnitrophota bacterium]
MAKGDMKEKMDTLWKKTKKDIDKVMKEADGMMKKGEKYLKDMSGKGKSNLDVLSLTLQREKLYYELGKTVAYLSESKDVDVKKEHILLNEIKAINIQIDKLKKKA